jgi:predicted DCC family thiol-disulfide oxidoreductase YuxK
MELELGPALVYDGDCGFCQRRVDGWRRRHGEAIEFLPSQSLGARFPQLPRDRFDQSVFLVEEDGRTREGADAVFALAARGGMGLWAWLYRRLPGFRPLSEWGYRCVARHRHLLGSPSCRLPERDR